MELLEFLTHLVQAVCAERRRRHTVSETLESRGESVQRSGRASPPLDLYARVKTFHSPACLAALIGHPLAFATK